MKKFFVVIFYIMASNSFAKGFVAFDIDNVLFDNGKPIYEMINKAKELEKANDMDVIYISGRKNTKEMQDEMKEWLSKVGLDKSSLYLKPKNEFDTAKFKYKTIIGLTDRQHKVLVIDDNPQNLKPFFQRNVRKVLVEKTKLRDAVNDIDDFIKENKK